MEIQCALLYSKKVTSSASLDRVYDTEPSLRCAPARFQTFGSMATVESEPGAVPTADAARAMVSGVIEVVAATALAAPLLGSGVTGVGVKRTSEPDGAQDLHSALLKAAGGVGAGDAADAVPVVTAAAVQSEVEAASLDLSHWVLLKGRRSAKAPPAVVAVFERDAGDVLVATNPDTQLAAEPAHRQEDVTARSIPNCEEPPRVDAELVHDASVLNACPCRHDLPLCPLQWKVGADEGVVGVVGPAMMRESEMVRRELVVLAPTSAETVHVREMASGLDAMETLR